MTKISTDDGQKISDLQEQYAELATEIARNFFMKLEAEVEEQALKDSALQLIVKRASLNKEMTEKYGDRFHDLEIEQ